MRTAFRMTQQRCYNINCADYPYYGARGITIDPEWLDNFEAFVRDMGLRPEGMTLERLNVNGNYCKDNCVWANRKTQANNKKDTLKLTVGGATKTLSQWAEETGIAYSTLKARKQRLGYTDEQCLNKSVVPGEKLPGKNYKPKKAFEDCNYVRGFDSPVTRFTKEQALAIQKEYDKGLLNFTHMAKKYKCSPITMTKICKRQGIYADLPEAD